MKLTGTVILIMAYLAIGLGGYNLGRADQRQKQTLSYQDGMSAGVRLGCAARGKGL